jgi:hypothetical protein
MSLRKTILILNGPPSCGKDTLADAIVEAFGWTKVEFKAALRTDTAALFNVSPQTLRNLETKKEIPTDKLLHPKTGEQMSLRQALIYTSEEVIKPQFGKDHYGLRMLSRLIDVDEELFVCSDGGFPEELLPLCDAGVRVRIMRINRPGYTFANDSRNYIPEDLVLALSEDGSDIAMADFSNSDTYAKFIEEGSALALNLA